MYLFLWLLSTGINSPMYLYYYFTPLCCWGEFHYVDILFMHSMLMDIWFVCSLSYYITSKAEVNIHGQVLHLGVGSWSYVRYMIHRKTAKLLPRVLVQMLHCHQHGMKVLVSLHPSQHPAWPVLPDCARQNIPYNVQENGDSRSPVFFSFLADL